MKYRKTIHLNHTLTNRTLTWSFSLLAFLVFSFNVHAASETASNLFERHQPGVFQIRTIDLASGDKSTIGSGFAVKLRRAANRDSYIATNFHVVSLQVHSPETYRLEVASHTGERIGAELVAIDVIHDLALLKIDSEPERIFRLRNTNPDQGERIFSMGNPQDLGMTIIEGNYNGLVQNSRYQNILFSGSLNAGMSGGPAIDDLGRVLGINVAKGSEQISFLVPASRLSNLLEQASAANKADLPKPDFQDHIRNDLYNDQASFYSELIEQDWPLKAIGGLLLPHEISDSLKCWGHTVKDKNIRYESAHQHCQSNDTIFIADNFQSGQFEIDFEWLETTELNTFQFYTALEKRFTQKRQGNASDDDDVSNYECSTNIVTLDNSRWKVSSCFRAYKAYADLFDALLLLSSLDRPLEAGVVKVSATGISRNSARTLFGKLMESIKWKP